MKSSLDKSAGIKAEIYQSDFKCRKLSRIFDENEKSMALTKALKPFLIFGQFFGMLPVSGLSSNNVEDFNFRFCSFKVIFSIFLQIIGISEFIMVLVFIVRVGLNLTLFGVIISYGMGVITTLYMFSKARKWRIFMRIWDKHEEIFLYPPYSNQEMTKSFIRKVKFVGILMIGYTIFDHFFRMTSEIYKGYLKHEKCFSDKDFLPTAKSIYISQRSIFFRVIEFQAFYAPIFEWIHISRRVAWAYSEILIIVFAMNLSIMYRKFNDRLIRIRNQAMWHSYWKEMREHYVQLCNLVEHANSFVSPLLTVIVFADFFFLCERLFRLFNSDPEPLEEARIVLLGTFFLVRSFVLFHYCSNINQDAQEPLRILRDAPMENWTTDFQRLVDLVEDKNRGFTGMNFFVVSKGLVLSFIGTVLTYQLVVMQQLIAAKRNSVSDPVDICSK